MSQPRRTRLTCLNNLIDNFIVYNVGFNPAYQRQVFSAANYMSSLLSYRLVFSSPQWYRNQFANENQIAWAQVEKEDKETKV